MSTADEIYTESETANAAVESAVLRWLKRRLDEGNHIWVHAITDEMVERAARSLVNYDCSLHNAPTLRDDQSLDEVNNPGAYRDRARVALVAAFSGMTT